MSTLSSDFSRHSLNTPLGTCGTPHDCSLPTHKALCCTQQHPIDHTVLKHPRCPTQSGSLEGHLGKAKSSMSLPPSTQIHPYSAIDVLIIAMSQFSQWRKGRNGNNLSVMNLKKYGKAPFIAAVVHGGPGAGGEMAPVARELTSECGVLEPIQTAASLQGQVKELRTILEKHGDIPLTLIGFSWGAWLSFILTAYYPACVKKLILIGSGPFEEEYAAKILDTRLNRLSEEEQTEVRTLMKVLNNPAAEEKSSAFVRIGTLISKADAYAPIISKSNKSKTVDYRADIFQIVWKDAAEMRRSGKLLKLGKHIQCPVIAIHGNYDPHPFEGVQKPLSTVLKNFRMVLLKNCGHKPWIEQQASGIFYDILKEELSVYK